MQYLLVVHYAFYLLYVTPDSVHDTVLVCQPTPCSPTDYFTLEALPRSVMNTQLIGVQVVVFFSCLLSFIVCLLTGLLQSQ